MEIHFIWIEHYQSLNHKSIHLSARFNISLDITDNNTFTLSIRHNPDFIENFFGKENIENVTAIIGKNGSGKSTILEYIKSHLPDGLQAGIQHDIFIYSTQDPNGKIYQVLYPSKYTITINDQTGLFVPLRYDDFPGDDNIRLYRTFANAEYIYYSFFLDQKPAIGNWHGLHDISTTALLQQERTKIFDEYREDSLRAQMLSQSGELQYFYASEMQRAMQFLISDFSSLLPFPRPDSLTVEINNTDRLYFDQKENQFPEIKQLLVKLENQKKSGDISNNTLDSLLIALLTNFLITEKKYNQALEFPFQYDINPGESIKSFVLRVFADLANATFFVEGEQVSVSKYQDLGKLAPSFVAFVEENIANNTFSTTGNENKFIVKLTEQSYEAFKTLCNYYLKIKGLTTFLDFTWSGLSTGEQSYLSFVSRFYHVRYHEHGNLGNDLVILIDEGDAGYHPDWQRRFFNRSLDLLTTLFRGRKLQLIFTANAPFITSDLPKSHILFLEKKYFGDTVFHGRDNDRENTFGANIHSLFSNSFYMHGVLMGEFAKAKIDAIILYLKSESDNEPRQDYKRTIGLIGEPVLRNKLIEMWTEKFGPDEEIELLQKRIDFLRNRKSGNL